MANPIKLKRLIANLRIPGCLWLWIALFGLASNASARNHVIIAFDNFVGYEHVLLNKQYMVSQINRILRDSEGRQLLNDSDYVSVVTFGLGLNNSNFKNFALPSTSKGKPMRWLPFKGWNETFTSWSTQVLDKGGARFDGPGFSMLSAAKPFILSAVKSPGEDTVADRTYILMVTDDHYNGNDNYRKEFQTYQMVGGKASEKEFSKQLVGYHTMFKDVEVDRKEIASGLGASYYLILLEIIPTNIPSINGVLDIPANLNLHRVPGGYRINFNASSVDDLYSLAGLDLTVHGKDCNTYAGVTGKSGKMDLKIPSGAINPNDVKVEVKASVIQKDCIYNGMLASVDNPNTPRMSTSRRLTVDDGGKIFGKRMPDWMWWWYRGNAYKAAFIWEVVIVVLLLAFLVWLISLYNKGTTKYRLRNHEIGMKTVGAVHTDVKKTS